VQSIKTPLLTILFIFLGFFLYTKLFGPIPFSVNSITTTKANLFSVAGIGKATGIPDTAQISIGVTKTASTVADAQNQTNTAANKITENFKQLGIPEKNIKTTNYSVNPNYDFNRGEQNVIGYTVTQTLEVKSSIDTFNKVIDAATANGANLVGGVNFTFNEKTKKELENKARVDAVEMAKEKAESLAKATGIKLGRIVDVQESGNFEPKPLMMMETLETKSADTQIQPGENSITINIILSYETF